MAVAVVNYNTRDRLRECLRSIDRNEIDEVLVADNGSSDGSAAMVREEFPDVVVVSLPHNPGFGAAINELVSRTDADVVVALNADVRLESGAIGRLTDRLAADSTLAVVGPRLVDDDGHDQRSAYPDYDVTEMLRQESGLHHVVRRSSRIDWILGAALAVRRTAFDEVGGFDEGFFLYFEEVDLCRRLRALGWRFAVEPDAVVHHTGGASTGHDRTSSQLWFHASMRRYVAKHRPGSERRLRFAVRVVLLARSARDAALVRVPFASTERRARAELDRRTWSAVLASWREAATTPVRHEVGERSSRGDWLLLMPEVSGERPSVAASDGASAAAAQVLRRHLDAVEWSHDHTGAPNVMVRHAGSRRLVPGPHAAVEVCFASPTLPMRWRSTGWRRSRRSRSYAVVPSIEAPRCFVPLDHSGAIRYYAQRLFAPTRPTERWARAAVVAFPTLMRFAARDRVVVTTSGGDPVPEVVRQAMGSDVDAVIVLTSGHDAGSRSVALGFTAHGEAPRFVVKVAAPGFEAASEREHDDLRRMGAQLPLTLRSTVPTALGVGTWRERTTTTESAAAGTRLDVVLRDADHPASRVQHLHHVALWLTEFQMSTSECSRWDEAAVAAHLRVPMAEFASAYGASPDLDRLFERTLAVATAMVGAELPVVHRHFDLAPWNIVLGDALTVIDWEAGGDRPPDGRGLPLCDLLYFVKYWMHIVTDADELDELSCFEFSDGEASGPARSASVVIARYVQRLGIDPRFIPVLAVANWLEHAVNDCRRAELAGAVSPGSRAADYVRALAASADLLFDRSMPPVERRRRVGVVSPFPIDDTSHGAPRAVVGMIGAISTRHEVAVLERPHATAPERDDSAVPLGARWGLRVRHIVALGRGRSSWSYDWDRPGFRRAMSDLVQTSDVVHVEFVVLADLLPANGPTGGIVVTDHNPPVIQARHALRTDPLRTKPLRLAELWAWKRTYRRLARRTDAVVVFDQRDRRVIERWVAPTPIEVVPFPVEVPREPLSPAGHGPPTIAMVANFHRTTNSDAARVLLDEVMPIVWSCVPDARVRLVGPFPERHSAFDSRVTSTGHVADLGHHLDDVAVMVAPIRLGGGMRVKVLEALAFGKSTVASSVACAGLPDDALDIIVVADDPNTMAGAIVDLLVDPVARTARAESGRRWAEHHLAPDRSVDRYDDLYTLLDALDAWRRVNAF